MLMMRIIFSKNGIYKCRKSLFAFQIILLLFKLIKFFNSLFNKTVNRGNYRKVEEKSVISHMAEVIANRKDGRQVNFHELGDYFSDSLFLLPNNIVLYPIHNPLDRYKYEKHVEAAKNGKTPPRIDDQNSK